MTSVTAIGHRRSDQTTQCVSRSSQNQSGTVVKRSFKLTAFLLAQIISNSSHACAAFQNGPSLPLPQKVPTSSMFSRRGVYPKSSQRPGQFLQNKEKRRRIHYFNQHWSSHFISKMKNSPYTALKSNVESSHEDGATIRKFKVTLPTNLVSFFWQVGVALVLYTFHLAILTQHQLVFPIQLLPFKDNTMASMGWDSIAGMGIFIMYNVQRKRIRKHFKQAFTEERSHHRVPRLPPLLRSPKDLDSPWHLPNPSNEKVDAESASSGDEDEDTPFVKVPRYYIARGTFMVALSMLVTAYFGTGRFSLFWEDCIYAASAAGWPITIAMQRSLTVLAGHLSWVLIGSTILALVPRPPKFFTFHPPLSDFQIFTKGRKTSDTDDSDLVDHSRSKSFYRWFLVHCAGKRHWVWWAVGGYYVSSWLFNIADTVNQLVLPAEVLEGAAESVVTQLVNPEYNDWIASVIGYIAPCVTAPAWEEVLYRGFLLPGLANWTGHYHFACLLQAVIFSAHHMSVTAALPLAVLGWTWAVLYTKSRNLFTVIAVHAMWNSRVFIGSWLGL